MISIPAISKSPISTRSRRRSLSSNGKSYLGSTWTLNANIFSMFTIDGNSLVNEDLP